MDKFKFRSPQRLTMPVKNIIFDLGGIFLNIDYKKTSQAFTALGVKDFDQYFTQIHSNPLFAGLETGTVVDHHFYDTIRSTASISANDLQIDEAWNAMLLDFPKSRITKLKSLAGAYRLFLFSNTNAIHHRWFQRNFKEQFHFSFDTLFEKAWYSHLIGYRKPAEAAYRYVLEDAQLEAIDTLFIDDTLQNIEGAAAVGIKAVHLPPGKDLEQLLDEVL